MYVDFDYYSNTYKGKVKEENFTALENKASGLVNYYTFNRIEEVDEQVKLTVCELIDNINEMNQLKGDNVTQEKVGSYSVSYANSSTRKSELKEEQKNIIFKHLAHTGLLYRGV